jgi:ABC-type multidrug transport system fused ATPase/permease subunit
MLTIYSFNNYFPGSLFKLVISFTFLVEIIGWKALGAGLISMLIVIPFNIFFAKRYAAAQGRLMEIRDQKEAKISEALKGIRQIKFSALEGRWQDSLNQIRGKELVTLWDVFISDTCLLFCWVSSPIILAATSLAVYSLSNRLSPSVAFTSIGIFNTLQVTLAVVPELTTDLLDAIISINRIQAYLESPEIDLKSAKDSPNIIFDNATFAWPSDEEKEDGDERFVLRNVNIDFPKGELSVISGKTGSGKSMLLAAILREVDIISGTLYIPKALKHWERHDNKATKENWIIPNSIAFVAQIPWIENATIKDNVLFGLPLDEERYKKTIEACALRKDLEMLPDGEKTEIGANGINLSGGQKWRLSFARALYSRAGILVLDDIFSAVDAHVGRHIFEKGLVGELGVGRTRILVTHHVALCKSKTKYLVELGEGTVLNAGLLSELEEDGTLTKIISHEQASKMVIEDEDITAVNSEESSDIGEIVEPLQKVDTRASARKFVEEEKKEKGAVKGKLYVEYLRSSGGVAFWGGAAIIFTSQQALKLGKFPPATIL